MTVKMSASIEKQEHPNLELIIDHQPWTVTYSYNPSALPTVIVDSYNKHCHIINEDVDRAKRMVWMQYHTKFEWGEPKYT
jgi:hypothetical protein